MRRSLALLVAATTSLVLVAFLVPLAVLIRSGTAEQAVSEASGQASALALLVATADRDAVDLALDTVQAGTGHPFSVFYPDGAVLGASAERSAAVELAASGAESLTVQTADGRDVLVAVGLPDEGGTGVVATSIPASELTEGVVRTWVILLCLGVGLVALGVVVADRLARSMVRPVVDASAVAHRLAGGDLDARADPAGPPEIQAVATGLNHLAARISGMLRDEREAVADISHRLRTPLTALRLEAEALPDEPRSDRIVKSVDALERAVTQVIADARSRGADPGASCDAAGVVTDRIGFWSVLAEDTDRPLTVDIAQGPVLVRASDTDLAAGVDALLGNVFAHTPDGTPFSVMLVQRTDHVRLVVADGGGGFSRSDSVRRGTSDAASTGLGLDIARRVAESSGGRLTTGVSALGGAEVTVELGRWWPAEP
ncbi:MAG TPA: HAMP domain-containing sensor histidine kinase [Jiangellaceae bacterium]|jgi:signal transduction histidine kinase|nr:HAMP domain-containing sensor histidine kinase [Jiangellaceae bacterium]